MNNIEDIKNDIMKTTYLYYLKFDPIPECVIREIMRIEDDFNVIKKDV